jgi:ABC-type glycerol-3-phosphate transport system substrate-binding protein
MGSTAAGAASVGVLPVLAACGGAPESAGANTAVKLGDPVTVLFWHPQTGPNEQALLEMVKKFNTTNGKGITIQPEYHGDYTPLYQKIMASIQAGQKPDVAVAYESQVVEYMKAKAVVALDDYAFKGQQAFSKESLADIFPSYIEANKYPAFQNKMLSFPFTKSLAVNYVNEELFKSAGVAKYGVGDAIWSMDEFKRAMAAVSKKGSVIGHHIRIDTSYIDAFIFANGGEAINKEETKVRFNEAPAVEVFEMWSQMVKDGHAYAVPPGDRSYQNDFTTGKNASIHDSSTRMETLTGLIQDKDTKKDRIPWSVGMIPQKDPKKPQTVMFGGNIAVFQTTPLKQAASWEWIKFFMEKDQTAEWAVKSSYMPTRKSAVDNPTLKAHWERLPQAKQAFNLAQYARPEPQAPAWQAIRDDLANALQAVVSGKSTPKQALDEAARQANRRIEETK